MTVREFIDTHFRRLLLGLWATAVFVFTLPLLLVLLWDGFNLGNPSMMVALVVWSGVVTAGPLIFFALGRDASTENSEGPG